MFQLVGIAGNNAILIELAMAILQTPFYQGPNILGYLLITSLQTITTGSVSQHSSIATVEEPKDIIASTDNAPGNEFIFRVDVFQVPLPSGHGTLVTLIVTQEGEEGVDVFRLIIAPHSSIIRLASRSVHQSSLGVEDTLAGTNLTHLKERIDGVIRTDKAQFLTGDFLNKLTSSLQFLLCVYSCFLFISRCISLYRSVESGTLSWLQGYLPILLKLCLSHQTITATGTLFLVGSTDRTKGRHNDGLHLIANILDGILLADSSLLSAGEEDTRQFKVVVITLQRSIDSQQAVDSNNLHLLLRQASIVGSHSLQEIHIASGHPAGMRIIGNGSEHREYQVTVHVELLLAIYTPIVNHRGT